MTIGQRLVDRERNRPTPIAYNVIDASEGRDPWSDAAEIATVELAASPDPFASRVEIVSTHIDADGVAVEVDAEGNHWERPEPPVTDESIWGRPDPGTAPPTWMDEPEPSSNDALRVDIAAMGYKVGDTVTVGGLEFTKIGDDPFPLTDQACDMCRAATLVETGVMPATLAPELLHSKCRLPGICVCGCVWSQGGRCVNCKQGRPMAELARQGFGEERICVDAQRCAKTMLDQGPAPRPRKAANSTGGSPRPSSGVPKVGPPCKCNCGERTGGGEYLPGHNGRHVKALAEQVKGGSVTTEWALAQLSTDGLRGKLLAQATTPPFPTVA